MECSILRKSLANKENLRTMKENGGRKMDSVLFDLDGTLLDTLDDLADSVNYALGTEGFVQRTREEIRSFVGNGVANLVHRSVPVDTPKEIEARCLETFRAHYAKNMNNKTAPYPGILPLLKALYEKGIRMAVSSNKFDAAVKQLCAEQFGGYIQVAIGESETVKKKPAPDGPWLAIEQMGSQRENTFYVGDSEVDVETAKNAGLVCVGVTWGFRDRKVLEDKGADYIIDKPEQLLALF